MKQDKNQIEELVIEDLQQVAGGNVAGATIHTMLTKNDDPSDPSVKKSQGDE